MVARHEVGHALVGAAVARLLATGFSEPSRLSIIPRTGGALGFTYTPPQVGTLLPRLCLCLLYLFWLFAWQRCTDAMLPLTLRWIGPCSALRPSRRLAVLPGT